MVMDAPTNKTITRTVIHTERTSELGWLLCSCGTCICPPFNLLFLLLTEDVLVVDEDLVGKK